MKLIIHLPIGSSMASNIIVIQGQGYRVKISGLIVQFPVRTIYKAADGLKIFQLVSLLTLIFFILGPTLSKMMKVSGPILTSSSRSGILPNVPVR